MVHNDNSTGNKNYVVHRPRLKRLDIPKSEIGKLDISGFDIVRIALTRYPASEKLRETAFPAGWIEEIWFSTMEEHLLDKKGPFIFPQYTVSHYWHTWFSGIYRLKETEFGVWCLGGKYPEIIEKLELKKRTEPIK